MIIRDLDVALVVVSKDKIFYIEAEIAEIEPDNLC